jgi:hypothetical protein
LEDGVFVITPPTVIPVITPPAVIPVITPPPFVLPHWIQVYLYQLQRMGRPVPQWLTAYIAQLKLWAMNKRDIRDIRDIRNPNQKLTMKMMLSR